jgi:hypothetical protein
MRQDHGTVRDAFAESSLRKQLIYRRYTDGQLTWLQAAQEIERIQPPPPDQSWGQRAAVAISAFLLAVLIPPWARRDD